MITVNEIVNFEMFGEVAKDVPDEDTLAHIFIEAHIVIDIIDEYLNMEKVYCCNCKYSKRFFCTKITKDYKELYYYKNTIIITNYNSIVESNKNNNCPYFYPSISYRIKRWFS
jgi:hypothetical protein